MKKVAVSVHANDSFSLDLIKDLKNIDYIHVDVMDGKFVRNTNLNLDIFSTIKNHFDIPIIAHMMVQYPSQFLPKIIDYIDYYLIHFEIEEDKLPLLRKVKIFKKCSGIVLNPETEISKIEYLLADIDLVLILGVHPGWSGQKFIPKTIDKVNQLAEYKKKYKFLIDVDGGITIENAAFLRKSDIITSATSILKADHPNDIIKLLKNTF